MTKAGWVEHTAHHLALPDDIWKHLPGFNKHRFDANPLGQIKAKGKLKPVNLFVVTGEKPRLG